MDLEGCWVSRFHFLEVGSWILRVDRCSVYNFLEVGSWILRAARCQGFIFLGGGIMDFQGVQVSILEVGSCMPYILFILVIYIICIMYIHNMLFHMVPFSASAFKVPFGFCYCHKICTKKRKKNINQANSPHEISVFLPCFHSLYSH